MSESAPRQFTFDNDVENDEVLAIIPEQLPCSVSNLTPNNARLYLREGATTCRSNRTILPIVPSVV
jgi:hypothetical protein